VIHIIQQEELTPLEDIEREKNEAEGWSPPIEKQMISIETPSTRERHM
jgi:hypothetical protein